MFSFCRKWVAIEGETLGGEGEGERHFLKPEALTVYTGWSAFEVQSLSGAGEDKTYF